MSAIEGVEERWEEEVGGGRRDESKLNLPVDANSLSLVEISLSVDGGDALGVT